MRRIRKLPGFLSLIALVFQNTALVLVMKHSYRKAAHQYSAASVVVVAEAIKFLACFFTLTCSRGIKNALDHLFEVRKELNLALPSILYVLQNNLLFDAVKSLPTTVYVVCSQGKTLTSAFFSFHILKRVISRKQWFALFLLVNGMIMVQMSAKQTVVPSAHSSFNIFRGLCSVTLACVTSGFAGVYLEKLYKEVKSNSMVARNMQLSVLSLPVSFLFALMNDNEMYRSAGFFYGFDRTVVLVVLFQAFGGILMAAVMRYASTLTKCFAVSISVCVASMISTMQGQEVLSYNLTLGVLLVNVATIMYAL